MKQWIYPLMIIFAASCYGILSTIIKLAIIDGFTASEAVTAQYFTGFVLALIIFAIVRRKLPKFGGGVTLVLAGLFTATTGTVYGQAVTYMPASIAVVMLFQFTWIGMLFDCIARRRLPKRIEIISLILLFAGTILAAGVIGADISGIPWQGWAWGLASAVSFASFVMVNSKQVEGMDTETRLLFTSFFAVIAITFFQSPEIVWNGILFGEGLWIYGLILGLFGIVIPIYLFSIAVPKVGAATSSILSAMELPVAVTVSVILLRENLTFLQVIGILVILFGMTLPTVEHRLLARKEK
ncbi:DMT family transporter [Sporosarcina pasteurii]|uniref:Predicted permease, DMT superfamily n=1 Tax=Sporosarcina pasteurii TaxID=1474 RepID=A0A380BDB7_SPOPA|nr:DMT family transporter [Sporosarcina pasteurii]MDS9472890.1 DMT family transporter [Sporosarcina pasteurii]QBQ06438.1 DMT family transporter [Sporosarcina pasteurii]SUI98483.1 Predicted permease, DMT superfamily [Sporosarcina pasteurii]